MRFRDLALKLDDLPGLPLSRRLGKAIEDAIRDGRLKPGVALPGSRALAEDLGISRNTVIAALDQLVSEGWLESEASRGTFVSPTHPARHATPPVKPGRQELGFDVPSRMTPITAAVPGALNLADGHADSRLSPTEEMAKAYQRALRRHGQDLLQHGEPQGNLLLRQAIASWVSERHGVAVDPEQVLITMGGQMSLQLLCPALLRPGDAVAVENPGNKAAWEVFQRQGQADVIPVAVDGQGLIPEALEEALQSTRIRLIYLTPRRQFPMTVTLSPERAKRILDLAAEHRVAVLEDDQDAEFHYGDQPLLPLYSRDTTGQVIFSSSFSRLLAPGLKVGYLILPPALVSPLARLRRDLDLHGDRVLEWSVADLLRDGEVGRHLRRARKVYAARRDHLANLLRRDLEGVVAFEVPDGGLALWVRVLDQVDVAAWLQRAKEAGLILHSPARHFLGPPEPCFRMGFSQVDEPELEEAVRRLHRSWPALKKS